MDERGNKGVWIGLIVAILLALVFFVLWLLRGGELDRLESRLRASQAEALSAAQRLEDDLRRTRLEVEAGNRKAAELESRVRDEQRRASESVQQAERRLQSTLDATSARLRAATAELDELRETANAAEERRQEAEKRIEEAENARKELDDSLASSRQREDGVGADLDEARKTIAALETRAGDAEASLEELRRELSTTREDLNKTMTASRETSDLDALRADLARMETALAGAQNANAALEELRNRLSQTLEWERQGAGEREAALRAEVEKLREAEGNAGEGIADPDPEAEAESVDSASNDWESRARELEGEWRRKVTDAEDEARRQTRDQIEREWRESAQQLEGELSAARRATADAEAAAGAARKQLAEAAAAHQDELERRIEARERELRGVFDREKVDLRARIGELERDIEETSRSGDSAGSVSAPAADAGVEENASGGTGYIFVADPNRSVGQIVEMLNDGRTFLIKGGSFERVHPGMRFEVHRRDIDKSRYVGMIRVTRTMDHYSMAEAVAQPPAAKICPVTGRAVLEPEAQSSPFVMAEDGRPIPLLGAADSGRESDVPAIGDYIDNPFYTPEREKVFGLDAGLAGDAGFLALIKRTLGGIPCIADGSSGVDFLLVTDASAAQGSRDFPRRISRRYLECYAEPAE